MEAIQFLKINPADNVVVAIQSLEKGQVLQLEGSTVEVIEDIPAGHKLALLDFAEGDHIVKYGYPIGHARSAINKGALVNEKNIKTNLDGVLEYTYEPQLTNPDYPQRNLTFQGYRRANGEVGIRNEIWIVPTVGCVNGIIQQLADGLRRETNGAGVDAIVHFPHNYGCSQLGDDHANTRKVLLDMVKHPNAGGILVVGLGCENNQISVFKEMLGDIDSSRIKFMETQKVKDEYDEGMSMLRDIHAVVSKDERVSCSISDLKIGLKCGGSDGFSGITANPLLGVFSDFLISQGGTTVLTEVPEMFGAETILMNRTQDRSVFDKTVFLINDFKEYFIKNDQPIYENPSPGNKAGGISTLEEKSLGCTQKCGKAVVRDVLSYGERLVTKGLNLLSAPGNDLVAATALGAAGCQMVLFTTGRGTPFGSFVPTLKISTNTPLFENKPGWIDFNAGSIVQGESMEAAAERFIGYLLEVANGSYVNNEKKGYREISIFKTGVTL